MNCPTCDEVMEKLTTTLQKTFWCAHCGTLCVESSGGWRTAKWTQLLVVGDWGAAKNSVISTLNKRSTQT